MHSALPARPQLATGQESSICWSLTILRRRINYFIDPQYYYDYYTTSLWSQLTACHAHPTSSAGAFSLLKFALQPEEEDLTIIMIMQITCDHFASQTIRRQCSLYLPWTVRSLHFAICTQTDSNKTYTKSRLQNQFVRRMLTNNHDDENSQNAISDVWPKSFLTYQYDTIRTYKYKIFSVMR